MSLDKIQKCLNLTLSENDNEALAALRMAQNLAAKVGINWQLIATPKEVEHTVYKEAPQPVKKEEWFTVNWSEVKACLQSWDIPADAKIEVANCIVTLKDRYDQDDKLNLKSKQWLWVILSKHNGPANQVQKLFKKIKEKV